MIIPGREKGVRSLRIPQVFFRTFLFLLVIFLTLLGIFAYDYWKILREIHRNKHLTIENRQLKEQIQLFQMKINSLTEDLERIHTFEKKLRIITGLESVDMARALKGNQLEEGTDSSSSPPLENQSGEEDRPLRRGEASELRPTKSLFKKLQGLRDFERAKQYQDLKGLYEQKIAARFGLRTSYPYTKEWGQLTKQSFGLASEYAEFDYKFSIIKDFTRNLEINVHHLDGHLLDKESFLRSTPTLLPTKGWITSYYGPRLSPTSKRLRMHEGLDIGARPGTPIVSPADGQVAFAGTKPGFGKFVQLDHGYGVETFYAHVKKFFVRRGQIVRRGLLIASVGSTGSSTGPHLHYEIRVNGTPVDPLYFVLD